jgi:hypothetical protein
MGVDSLTHVLAYEYHVRFDVVHDVFVDREFDDGDDCGRGKNDVADDDYSYFSYC